jgi:alginate O-acetyltransferase complex protein AlgI
VLFNSYEYLLFLPVVVALYWLLPRKSRLPMLLLASYIFYASWIPAFLLLIFGLTLFNWLWGKWLHRAKTKRKLLFGIGLAANLLTLGLFKYANFFIQSVDSVWHLVAHRSFDCTLQIILPLGISFFAFEFIHYLFEVYKGNKPVDSFVLFALFAAFFPTQISGPIKRYPDFVAQMNEEQTLKLSHFDDGLPLILIGLTKKLLFADNLAALVQMGVSAPGAYGALELCIIAYAFAFQIYFDFSGYTDIARGSAMLFGYHIPINFNMPYIAANISDFWRRWHISLSTWLRDYLFIPLGGSRGGRWKTNQNLLWTMALGGLWHGASWNFVVWGIYHGLCLVVHREYRAFIDARKLWPAFFESKLYGGISMIFTFHVVCIGWVFFRVQDIKLAFSMVKGMVLFHPFFSPSLHNQLVLLKPTMPVMVPLTILLTLALCIINFPLSRLNESGILRRSPAPLKAVFCTLLVLALVVLCPDNSAPFIYFQF